MKRGNGEGSIYRRSDGRWSGAISYLDKAGNNKRHTEYGKTQKEVRDKLKAARLRLDAGAPVRDAKVTLAAYVAHWNATTLAASDRKASTKELYAGLARTHLSPAPLGAIGLDRLRPSDVEAFVYAKRKEGKSSSTVRQVYTVLRAILDTAVRDELIAKNPAAAVKRPGVERHEARYLTPDEVRLLVGGITQDRLRAMYLLLLGSGLRRGEALALTWADVDLESGDVRVRGTLSRVAGGLVVTEPKTDKSRRTVALPQPVTTELRAHRIRQVEERLHAGALWQEGGYVFCTQVGTALDPRNALRSLQAVAKRVGLADVGLHTLRHSMASALIASGVHMKVVQELLGHSSYAITADVYAHVGVTQQRDAADRLGEAFGW